MLSFTGRMYGLRSDEIAHRSTELLDLMELQEEPKKLIVEYSHGMKKKLSLACALIHRPEILFLDEPFEGVDAIASRTLRSEERRVGKECRCWWERCVEKKKRRGDSGSGTIIDCCQLIE